MMRRDRNLRRPGMYAWTERGLQRRERPARELWDGVRGWYKWIRRNGNFL